MIVVHPKGAQPWRALLELQLAFAFLLLGFLPLGTLVLNTLGASLLFPFAAVYGGLVLFVQHRMINWKCPQCGKPFLRRAGSGHARLHRNHCGHCGRQRGSRH